MEKDDCGGIIGKNQEWRDKRLDCDHCGYDETGYIKEIYPHAGLSPLLVCPNCECGNEYAVA